jgi:PAS domain-containing protein
MPIVADTDKEDSSRVQLRFSYMRINRFIPILHGHTAFLGFVCAALVGVSFWFMFSSHDHLQAFSEIDAEEKSNRIVRQFEDVMLSSGSDSIAVSSFVGSVRVLDHLAYLVISDSTGAIISAYNPVGAHRAAFQFPEMFNNTGATLNTHRFGYELASPVFRGYLYVGFERIPMNAGLKRDARLLRMAGWAMLAVAMFLMASIGRFHVLEASMSKLRKTRRELAHQKGTLESEVHSQKEKEAELKQSEERYKSLLETTMESAFKDLERQKKSLEKEVEEKTITQKTLRRTTRRLRMLNGIERKIVDEETLEDILGHAVKELQELLNADRISVLQINYDDGVVVVKSESGNRLGASNDDGHIPLDWHRPFRKGLFVARNLNKNV